jgi:ligand-binding sensor domain-containing protein
MHLIKFIFLAALTLVCSCCQQHLETAGTRDTPAAVPVVIKHFSAVPLLPDYDTSLVSQYIRSIFQDSKGNLWFGTIQEGVVRYDSKSLIYFSNPDGFISNSVFAINEDHDGNMWFGTDQGLYKYDGRNFRNYDKRDGLEHIDISRKSILVDHTGNIWVGTHGGIFIYNPSAEKAGGKSFSRFSLIPKINVAGIMEDRNGNIWFASSNNGVYRYDGKAITHFSEPDLLGENYAGGMAEDKAGNIWFTMKNGICKYDGHAFTSYTAKDGLGGTEFWGIYIEQSGIMWITGRGSTTRFDPSLTLPNPKAFTIFTPEDGLNCCVQSMYQDQSGKMWWGTGAGLFRFNGERFYQVRKNGPW